MTFRLLSAALLLAAAAPLPAEPLTPDAGPFKAQGSWTDQDKHVGQWHAEGTLAGGRFTGGLALELLGVTRSVTLRADKAYVRGGTCVLAGNEGRNRVELRGACNSTAIGPGTLTGSFDGHGLRGKFEGTLAPGPNASAPPVTAPSSRPG